MCLWSPSTKVVQAVMIRQKIWLQGSGAIFPIYLYRKLEKKSSCQKPLDQFQYNLAEMFPWWPFTKIVQAVMICQKTWLLGGGAYFPSISIKKTWKNLLVRNHWTDFNITWQTCFLGDPSLVILYQDCSSNRDLSKNMAASGWGLFSLYIYIENFNNLLVRNHWTDFNIT